MRQILLLIVIAAIFVLHSFFDLIFKYDTHSLILLILIICISYFCEIAKFISSLQFKTLKLTKDGLEFEFAAQVDELARKVDTMQSEGDMHPYNTGSVPTPMPQKPYCKRNFMAAPREHKIHGERLGSSLRSLCEALGGDPNGQLIEAIGKAMSTGKLSESTKDALMEFCQTMVFVMKIPQLIPSGQIITLHYICIRLIERVKKELAA